MLAKDLAKKLSETPELMVMVHQPSMNPDSIVEISDVEIIVAKEDEYPEEWDMPKGYTFIKLS